MRYLHRFVSLGALFVLSACENEEASRSGSDPTPRAIVAEELIRLDDAGQPIIARPERISVDSKGRFFVTDYSDKNIKVYDATGSRVATIGRPGRGPGEFTALLTAQSYRDSLVAWDAVSGKLSVFAPDGRYVRAISLTGTPFPVWSVRVVDDSLFLAIAAATGIPARPALALIRPDGTRLSTFYEPGQYVGTSPAVIQTIFVLADAADGTVFAGLAGGDSLWTFDYQGRRLGAAPVDAAHPLRTSRGIIEGNRGKVQRADGSIVLDGEPALFNLVALDSGRVAMQVEPWDLTHGTDPLGGGRVIVAATRPDGQPVTIASAALEGGLLGRDREGAPLVLRYATANEDAYAITRLRLTAASTRGAP